MLLDFRVVVRKGDGRRRECMCVCGEVRRETEKEEKLRKGSKKKRDLENKLERKRKVANSWKEK